MATRLQNDFYSKDGDKYTVIIDDADWVGAVTDFNCTELAINYSGQSKEKYNPIITSDLALSILIENSTLETFLTALIGAEEERFTVKVNKNDVIYWVGIIKTDSVYIEDLPQPYNLKITATDGIGRLKDIDYNNDGAAYTGKETFVDHVFNILDKIGLSGFWAVDDTYFLNLIDWWETTQTKISTTDPINSARFDHKALIYIDQTGEKTYTSCYDVLKRICELLGARFMLSAGSYQINQVNFYADTGNVSIRKYTKSKSFSVQISTSLQVWDKEMGTSVEVQAATKDLFKVTSGGFSFFPPLAKVEVLYKHFATNNILQYQDISANINVEDIDYAGGTAKLAFQGRLDYSSTWIDGTIFFIFHLKIKIGSYYLKRDSSVQFGSIISETATSWTTDSTDRYILIVPVYNQGFTLTESFGFITDTLQESGDMDVQMTFQRAAYASNNTIDPALYTIAWYVYSPYLEILQEGTIEDQTNVTKFTSTNDISGNTAKLTRETLFGDGPTGNTFGHLEVTIDGGSSWGISDGWRVGDSGSFVDINQLLASEMLYGQSTPVKKMESCLFRGSYEAHYTLIRNSENFLFIGGRHNLSADTWDGEWFFLSVASSGVTEETPEEYITYGGPTRNNGSPSGLTPGLVIFEEGDISNTYYNISNGTDIPITTTDTDITTEDAVTDLDIPTFMQGDLYFDGDVIMVSSPNGAIQNFTSSGDHADGDASLSVDSSYANYDYSTGSNIVANPLYQQYDLSFGRRKFFTFDLQRYSVQLPNSSTYVTWDNFFRPIGDDATNDSFQFVDRVFFRKFHWIVAQNVSASASVDYTVRVLRGGSTVVSSGTFDGTDTYITTTPVAGEDLMQSDIYTFQIKRDDVSGLANSKGLKCIIECYNKRFQPDDFTTLDAWVKADFGISTASGGVYTWEDASGNTNHFNQSTSTYRPDYETNILNSYPGVLFNESSEYADSNLTLDPNASNFSVFVVFNPGTINTGTAETILCQLDGTGTGREIMQINTSKAIISELGNETLTGDTLTDDTNYIASLTWDGTTQSMRVNGATADTNTPIAEAANGKWRLGAHKTPGEYFGGYVHEVIIYSEALNDRRRELVEGYLSLKYNIAL